MDSPTLLTHASDLLLQVNEIRPLDLCTCVFTLHGKKLNQIHTYFMKVAYHEEIQ